jgi:hypothetical protein
MAPRNEGPRSETVEDWSNGDFPSNIRRSLYIACDTTQTETRHGFFEPTRSKGWKETRGAEFSAE